jgi:hypothetical protein
MSATFYQDINGKIWLSQVDEIGYRIQTKTKAEEEQISKMRVERDT